MPIDRILIIRPSALGDVCRSVPLLASLRLAHPDATIDWLVQDSFAQAVSAHPDLSNAIPFERRTIGKGLRSGRSAGLRALLRRLREARYDVVIDAQGLARSALLARSTAAPVRIGHADARELGWLPMTHRVPPSHEHTVDRMLELLEPLGVEPVLNLTLHCSEADIASARQRLGSTQPVVLAPSSRWAAKRWPADRWVTLADRLLDEGIGPICIVGGPGEHEQCGPLIERASQREGLLNFVGSTTVGQLMAVIRQARLVVSNDSAALHMAVGFDRPLIGLFGPTDVARVGPYGRDVDVLQRIEPGERLDHKNDENAAMMARLTVDEVASAASIRLSRASSRTPS